jgi:hypothetical protein
MRWLRQLFNFYIKASIHVAFAVVAFAFITSQLLNINLESHLVLFLLFGTIPAYNFIKYGAAAKKYLYLKNTYQKRIQLFSFLCAALGLYFSAKLSWETWKGICLLGILVMLYAIPLIPDKRNLRNLGILKIIMVSLVWTGTTVLLPVLEGGLTFSHDLLVLFLQRFILILVLMIPFEIRDLQTDPGALHTIPQRIGVRKTRLLGLLLSFVFFLLGFVKNSLDSWEVTMNSLTTVSLVILMIFTPKRQTTYFASFWVESFPIFWAGILVILR